MSFPNLFAIRRMIRAEEQDKLDEINAMRMKIWAIAQKNDNRHINVFRCPKAFWGNSKVTDMLQDECKKAGIDFQW